MIQRATSREIAYCGSFGAAALLLPVLFHMVHLGHVFMPMYLPLMALAFFTRPLPAAVTAFLVPLLSGAVTGMPPFYPPIAVLMSIELCVMAAMIAGLRGRRPRSNEWIVLAGVLLFGRVFYVAAGYFLNLWIELPAGFLAGLSIVKGWPGVVLMMVVIPPLVRAAAPLGSSEPVLGDEPLDRKETGGDAAAMEVPSGDKVAFFNSIAEKWDGWEDLETLADKFSTAFARWKLGPDETIVDVGCGTGNLTTALLKVLSPNGKVVAVDIAPAMIEQARMKNPDARVAWHVADAGRLPIPSASCDRIFCYSVWPHFDDFEAVLAEFGRVLRPGGKVHVWHLASREFINSIHAEASEAVRDDILHPANETASLFERCGYSILENEEDEDHYLVTARREE